MAGIQHQNSILIIYLLPPKLGYQDSDEAGGPRRGGKSFFEGRLFAERDP